MGYRWWISGLGVIALTSVLVGCQVGPQTEGPPDRTESIAVPGGECNISWWLTPLVEDIPEEAGKIAAAALSAADVSADEWEEFHALLDGDPDNDSASPVRLHGAAYLEVVRNDVRDALEAAGYPDTDRIIEVNSELNCEDG